MSPLCPDNIVIYVIIMHMANCIACKWLSAHEPAVLAQNMDNCT